MIEDLYHEIRTGLLAQGHRSADMDVDEDIEHCAYRSNDGQSRCAAGMAIPDHLYRPAMEDTSIDGVLDRYSDLKTYLIERYQTDEDSLRRLLRAVQEIHDNEEPEDWKYHLVEDFEVFNRER